MSKFIIYKVLSPLGYPVEIMSDGKPGSVTYEKLFENEEMRIMKIEATGAEVLKEVANVIPVAESAPQATTAPQEHHCDTCTAPMVFKQGISAKSGKPWSGWFCPNATREDKTTHLPIWLK